MPGIKGETVLVSYRQFGEKDAFGNDEESYTEPVEVEDVLIGKAETFNDIIDGQQYAAHANKTFCFPRYFENDLRGALITFDGRTYKVTGIPSRITDENIPPAIRWNIRVWAVDYDG